MTNRQLIFWGTFFVGLLVFLFLIRSILMPFVLGMFIAYFLYPVADKLERYGVSRGLAALYILIWFFLGLTALSLLIVPVIVNQMSGLIASLPNYLSMFEQTYLPRFAHWWGTLPTTQTETITTTVTDFSGIVVKFAGDVVTGVFHSGVAVLHVLSLILITPLVAFYLLRDWHQMIARFDRLLPRASAVTIRTQIGIIDDTLAGFIRGQINVCLILATYYAVGLSIAGLKYGIIIGLTTGLLVIVPYVGFTLGMILSVTIAIFQFDNFLPVGGVLAVFALGQVLENYFLIPRLVGEKVGLHPVWILFGMLSGGALFGFVGVLLGVPMTAVIGVLIRFALQRYRESSYYQCDLPPPAPPTP